MKPKILPLLKRLGRYVMLTAFTLSLTFSVLLASAGTRANIVVSGTVTDEVGEPLPGVNILVKGTTTGTISDIEGSYTVNAPEDGVLTFSFIGYKNIEVEVNNRTQIDVSMELDEETLDEVVVIGYGTRTKGDLTGAITTVDNNYLDQQPTADVSKALQGSASGVTVVSPATPGGNAEIRIRGMGTINNNGPLWVVDGVFGAQPPPPSQIESIQILKDASSTAIYGARGANGVILVTTKAGKQNQPAQIVVSARSGFSTPTSKYDLMTDPQSIGEMYWLEYQNDGLPTVHPHFGSGSTPVISNYLFPNGANSGDPGVDPALYDQQTYPITLTNRNGTDWLDEIYQNGLIQDYNLSVSGGSEKTTYSFHGNFLDENGILKHTSYQRVGLRSNIDTKLNNWLNVGQRLGVTVGQTNGWNGNNSHENLFNQIYLASPLIPLRDIAGNYAGGVVGGNLYDGPNPVAFLDRTSINKTRSYNISGNFYTQITPVDGLSLKSLLGYDIRLNNGFYPNLPAYESVNGARNTTLSENSATNFLWNWTNTASYTKTFGDIHTLDFLVGVEATKSTYKYISASRQEYFSTDINFLVLDAGATNQLNNGNGYAWSLFSYFSRLHYGLKNKYLVDLTVRRDGSSRFGANNRYGVFPAVSLGWLLTEERFMDGSSNWLDYLKLRASWGQSGNDQIGNYNSFSTFGSGPGNSFYAINGGDNAITLGYQSTAIGNPNAKWETTTSANFAVDATLFSSLDVSVDLWQKNTSDMLFPVAIPQVAGSASAPSVNIGSMENKGIDITLDYRGTAFNNALQFNIATNFSHYKNEVTQLSNAEDEFIQGFPTRQQIYTRTEAGHAFPEFYGYVVDGIFQTEEEADSHATNGTYNQPGNLKIRDVDGDGVITPDDRTYIGSPHPDFTAGLRLGLEFKGFDLAATLYSSVGNDIANYTSRFIRYGLFQGPNSPDRLYRSWGSPYLENNADAILPKASSSTSFEQNASTDYIEDGSYLRMQNLQLGYNFSQSVLEKLNISNLRLYVMGANLFTITNYSGLDPEITAKQNNGVAQEIDRGVDVGTWPISRQIMFGLNISL
ncbi:TonB-linked SusC/RagA family outer membrane protein [Catalinimonas alkaloidigena]|uniref:SusC/RagA family TonB-linked outer membrane protein n=1 Tax=Catalinimonas alkaloidigena TaxID=1075417 RepID=UPI0024050E82|nr:TonB-dependent receptor [Catalinimonas alkaloidigena]MDF9796437.1 TonB-linked SusC/RagA family outer membrane protein [Catalinimonas alkaloidigena]